MKEGENGLVTVADGLVTMEEGLAADRAADGEKKFYESILWDEYCFGKMQRT
jgi:hypothetical protein